MKTKYKLLLMLAIVITMSMAMLSSVSFADEGDYSYVENESNSSIKVATFASEEDVHTPIRVAVNGKNIQVKEFYDPYYEGHQPFVSVTNPNIQISIIGNDPIVVASDYNNFSSGKDLFRAKDGVVTLNVSTFKDEKDIINLLPEGYRQSVNSKIVGIEVETNGQIIHFLYVEIVPCEEHEWNVTCTASPQCNKCGHTEGQALGHDMAAATCTKPATCQRTGCGHTEGQPLGHDMTVATCVKPATCQRTGCNHTEGQPLGHDMTAATCAKPATCQRSGCIHTEGQPLGHDMAVATCTKPATCQRSGCIHTEGQPLGHDMTVATCTKPATCQRTSCNHTEGQPLGHTEEAVKGKAATCTATGLTAGKQCTVCKTVTVKQTTIAKLAHNYKAIITKATTSKDGKILKKCDCGYVGSTTTIKKVSKISLSKSASTYTGKVIKAPTITVKDSAGKTIPKSNYTISKPSKSLKAVGEYTYTIKLKGNYSGTKKLTFTIKPKATSVKKLKAFKKAFTVNLNKVSKEATGYEIMYATNSKFTKGKKTVKVTSYKTTSKKISKLTSKKTYYVKLRTYKTVKGVKIYSDWSKVKTIRTK